MSRRRRSSSAGAAQGVLRALLPEASPFDRLTFLGDGVTYRTWTTACVVDGVDTDLVVRVPRHDAGAEQPAHARAEAELLSRLTELDLPFAVPRVVGLVEVSEGLAMVQTRCIGAPLSIHLPEPLVDLRWTMAAFAAATLHRADPARLSGLLSGPATRADHARAGLPAMRATGLPQLDRAADWIEAHLPPETPSCLLHADLLGQNLLVPLLEEGPHERHLSVIDWERAELGDPALELAILTRGVRRPFGRADGLDRLLEAYHAHGGQPVTRAEVRAQELAMVAGWVLDAQRTEPRLTHHSLGTLGGLLRGIAKDA